MNNPATRFPRLAAALLRLGLTAEGRRMVLDAAVEDVDQPMSQGQAPGAAADPGMDGDPEVQASWARVMGANQQGGAG